MKTLAKMLRTGPVIVGEFRGGKAETARRFDKSDKNAALIEFGIVRREVGSPGDTVDI
jgi:hypothetical protein